MTKHLRCPLRDFVPFSCTQSICHGGDALLDMIRAGYVEFYSRHRSWAFHTSWTGIQRPHCRPSPGLEPGRGRLL